jgi:hypothetical protein
MVALVFRLESWISEAEGEGISTIRVVRQMAVLESNSGHLVSHRTTMAARGECVKGIAGAA